MASRTPGRLRAGTVLRIPPVHAVRKGETLYGIARDYSVTLAKLLELNKLPANARIKVGLKLFIPMEIGASSPVADCRAVYGEERPGQGDGAGADARALGRGSRVAASRAGTNR